MKKVPLKTIEPTDDNPMPLSYRAQILASLKAPENPQAGANYEEMERVVPTMRKIRELPEDADHVLLEDAPYNEVVKRITKLGFIHNDEMLYEMITDIKNAETVELEAVTA